MGMSAADLVATGPVTSSSFQRAHFPSFAAAIAAAVGGGGRS